MMWWQAMAGTAVANMLRASKPLSDKLVGKVILGVDSVVRQIGTGARTHRLAYVRLSYASFVRPLSCLVTPNTLAS